MVLCLSIACFWHFLASDTTTDKDDTEVFYIWPKWQNQVQWNKVNAHYQFDLDYIKEIWQYKNNWAAKEQK